MKRIPYKWAVVGMLWFVCFFNYADRQAIFSVFPRLKAEFGFDAVQLGLVGSAFAWIYAAGAPLAGFIADRVSRKKLILGGCAFWSVVTLLTGSCDRLWQFVAVRAMEGLGETFYFPATMSLLSDYHDHRTRSRAMSWHQSSVYAGTIGGSWFGAWFAEMHGWRSGFYVFGGLGLVLTLVLGRFLREPVRGAAETKTEPAAPIGAPLGARETLWEILRHPTATLLMLAFLGANFVATIFLTWTPTFLTEKFGFRLTTAGLSGSVFIHLASAISVPVGGWLADVLARRWLGGRILVQAGGLLLGAGFIVLVGLTRDVTTLLVAMTVFGLSKGLYDANIFASLYDVIAPRARASAAGVMNTVGWSGGALGPVAVGFATKYGRHRDDMANMSEAIAFGGVIYLAAAAILVAAAGTFRTEEHFPRASYPFIMKARFLSLFLPLAALGAPERSAVLASEFINDGAPYPECHSATLAETAPGQLAAAWFGGTKERNPDVGIWFARRRDDKWELAREVASGESADRPRVAAWNPVLFQPKHGPLFLFYKLGRSPGTWWGMVISSTDGGATWSAPRRLPDGILGPAKNKPVELTDGAWLSPSSTEGGSDGWRVHFERSTDQGTTWQKTTAVPKGPSFDAIQPSILFYPGGKLQAVVRTKQGVIAQTWSEDGGLTWSELTATDLPNPNSGIDAVTLADGRQLLVYNHNGHRATEAKGDRWPLDVALSDNGLKWRHVLTLESEPCKAGYAYPAVIQTSDGLVHVAYTWNRQHIKHVVINPKKL